LCVSALCVFAAAGNFAFDILTTQDPTGGISAIPASLNEWRTSGMTAPEQPSIDDHAVCGDDFFIREYGKKWNESFVNSGTNTFVKMMGAKGDDPNVPGIRLCRGWGKLQGQAFYFVADIEQNVPETQWVFSKWENGYKHPRKFTVKAGKEKTRVKISLGTIRNLEPITGISFECSTPGAEVRISNGSLVPMNAPLKWEGEFVVGFKPWKAGVSLAARPNYTLEVNGSVVSRGIDIDGQQLLKKDVTDLIKVGTNRITVLTPYVSGYSDKGHLVCEAFAISADGKVEMLSKGSSWRVSLGKRKGVEPKWSSRVIYGNEPVGKTPAFSGIQPMHAGPLQIRPADGRAYRIWDIGEEVAWKVDLPPEMKDVKVVKTVRNELTREEGESKKVGAYRAFWELRRGTNVLDKTSLEYVIAGPIAQDEYPAAEVDSVLDKRKKLVQEQDCTEDVGDSKLYAECSVMPDAKNPGVNKSRVVSEKGFKFRETGMTKGDWFGYKLDIRNLGACHVLEIDYADIRPQILLARIMAGYPVPFRNNSPGHRPGFVINTGAVRTGWMQPVSGEKQTMRVVFYPGSKNTTVSFETGGGRANVMAWRLYEVPGDLPAMKFPETNRLYGKHCERPLWTMWGAHANAKIVPGWPHDYDGVYAASYAAIANRIRYMRYSGQNLAVDGVYMYKQGFPTLSKESATATPDFDFTYMSAMMYRRNKIRAFACFEYVASPAIMLGGGYDIGDRETRESPEPVYPSYCVTRYGTQFTGFAGMGLNYLAPHVWGSITNVLAEIYERYEPLGAFEGLFVVNNNWWLPGFPKKRGYSFRDLSYDDFTVEMFERDTGISLGIPYDAQRYAKRYELLAGRYEKEWFAWRAGKIREAMERIREVVSKGKHKWDVYASPQLGLKNPNPFSDRMSAPEELDKVQSGLLTECGFDPSIYGKGTDAKVNLIPVLTYERDHDLRTWGQCMNPGSVDLVRKNDAVRFTPVGLDERWTSVNGLAHWWWRAAGSAAFEVRPSHTGAYYSHVDLCSEYTPRVLVCNWLDVNLPTAHCAEERRFATGFYATPEGEFEPFAKITGVQAKRSGNAVQLVNDTPYAVAGKISLWPFVTLEDAHTGKRKGSFDYRLPPYGITVFKVAKPEWTLEGRFVFEDKEASRKICKDAERVLASPMVMAGLRPENAKALKDACTKKDVYRMALLLRKFDVAVNASAYLKYLDKNPEVSKAEDLKVLVDMPQTVKFETNKPVSFGAKEPKCVSKTRARTVSFEIKTEEGVDSSVLLSEMPFRFDLVVKNGGVAPSFLYFGFSKEENRRRYFHTGVPVERPLAKGVWHKVVYHVDPDKRTMLMWVDGRFVDSLDMKILVEDELKPSNGTLYSTRPQIHAKDRKGDKHIDIEVRNFKILEGIAL
jgi:hypothetical protein